MLFKDYLEHSLASPKPLTADELAKRRAWIVTIILTIIGAVLFLKPFISIIMLAVLIAYLTNPIYKRLLKKFNGKKGAASALTTVILFLIIGIPVTAIIAIAIAQAITLVNDLGLDQLFADDTNLESSLVTLVQETNDLIENWVGIQNAISTDGVVNFLQNTLPDVLNALISSLLGIVSGIPSFFMNLIIFLFVYIGVLTNSKALIDTLQYLSPFEKKVNDMYFKRIGLMASAMLKGQLFIAFMQGLASAIGMWIVGLGDFFFFFLLLFTFMSLIPLGAGIITIPMGLLALVTGNVWQGVVILGNHFIIVTNIDNIRPKLVPKEAQMQAALTILAAFAGVAYFGLLGVIYGPIIMIIIVTTIQTYVSEVKKYEQRTSSKSKLA